MQTELERHSAEILPFIVRSPTPLNRLTVADRVHAMTWNETIAAPAGARLTIFARQPDDGPEVGDYIGIYRADDRWAVWGATRDGGVITVWHGPSGADIGTFNSMEEALAEVPSASIAPRIPTPVRARRRAAEAV